MAKKITRDIFSERLFKRAMVTKPDAGEFTVNRTALVLKFKKPFIDWVKLAYPAVTPTELSENVCVYLIPDMADQGQMLKWLKKHYDGIFTDQIDRWKQDGYIWFNQKRTFKMFNEWFDVSLHPRVYDAVDKPRFKKFNG